MAKQLTEVCDASRKREIVKLFLDDHIYRPLSEPPYEAVISGPLKPTYSGSMRHEPSITNDLLDRFAEQPKALKDLAELFSGQIFLISSPLYIGMASNLRKRLSSHRRLIEQLRTNEDLDVQTDGDGSFARTIVERKMRPNRLVVCIQGVESIGKISNLENVLNRVFFPVFGRN